MSQDRLPANLPEDFDLHFLQTFWAENVVIDLWENRKVPEGLLHRIVTMVTVRPGVNAETADPFIPWAGIYGIAWDGDVAGTPQERFMEALWQAHLRADERFADAEYRQVWPPPMDGGEAPPEDR